MRKYCDIDRFYNYTRNSVVEFGSTDKEGNFWIGNHVIRYIPVNFWFGTGTLIFSDGVKLIYRPKHPLLVNGCDHASAVTCK